MPRLVQQGPKDAKIVIVGEAPGATEDASGVPFSGGSGELLDRILSRAGIARSDCFITNVCHTRPPKNEFEYFVKPQPHLDLVTGLIQLKADLDVIRPNIVVALGSWPLQFLTGKKGIDKWRGSLLPSTLTQGLKVMGTYHPAYCLRVYDYKAVAEMDFVRVKAQSAYPELRLPHRNHILAPERDTLLRLLHELTTLTPPEWLAVDIECWEISPGKWKLACVGFSDDKSRSIVIPCNEPWQMDAIKQLCGHPCKKVFQNGQFDTTVLEDNGIPVVNFAWDTMLAHHALLPECAGGEDEMSAQQGKRKMAAIKKGLAFQASMYTDEPFYKDDGKLWKLTDDVMMFYLYNGRDAAVTREIRDAQEPLLREFGTLHVAEEALEQSKILQQITKRGIKIDMEWRAQLTVEYNRQVDNLQLALDQVAGGPANVKSSKQMMSLLYDKLKLPVKRHRESGNPTANKDAINELAGKYNHPMLQIILEIRQRRDFIERYLNAQIDADDRMRCAFDVTGTRSGRLSSRQSIYGSGTNLQNIPSRKPEGQAIRRMFIPDPGMVFVYRNYSQAEARVVAHLARCDRLIELFDDPSRDVHTENAARIFSIPLSAVTPDQRYLAKRVVHASNYGMGPDRLVQVVNEDAMATGVRIDRNTASRLIERYFLLYPEIREVFWKDVERELRYSRTLNTPFGRKRQFFGRWDEKLLREAYSYIPQSVVGDLGRKALVACWEQLEPEANVLLNVHDSILCQCKDDPDVVEHTALMMVECMKIPIEIDDAILYIPTDCKVGGNWQDRDKKNPESNPDGLRDIKKWMEEQDATSKVT